MLLFSHLLSLKPRASLICSLLGCIFILIGGLGSVYFLYQALIPFLGYIESGAIASSVLLLLGIGLLFIKKKQKTSLQDELIQNLLSSFKTFQIEKKIKSNAFPISLSSLIIGLVLSQLKNVKKFSRIYKS